MDICISWIFVARPAGSDLGEMEKKVKPRPPFFDMQKALKPRHIAQKDSQKISNICAKFSQKNFKNLLTFP